MATAKKSAKTKDRGEELRTLVSGIGHMGLNDAIEKKLTKLLKRGEGSVEMANAMIDLALASGDRNVRWTIGRIAGPALAKHVAAGKSLDPRIDPLVGLSGDMSVLRALYACIPHERREKIWERELGYWAEPVAPGESFLTDKRQWGNHLVDRVAKNLLDLCPEAAPFVERYRSACGPAKKPAPRKRRLFPTKKSDAPFVFADPGIINASDWDELDDTSRK